MKNLSKKHITPHPSGFWVRVPIARHYSGDSCEVEFAQKLFKEIEDAIEWRDEVLSLLGATLTPDVTAKGYGKFNKKRKSHKEDDLPVGICIFVPTKYKDSEKDIRIMAVTTKLGKHRLFKSFYFGKDSSRSRETALQLAKAERAKQVLSILRKQNQ